MAIAKKTNLLRQAVLFDWDEFYGLTLDIVLYNLGQDPAVKIHRPRDLERFERQLADGRYKKGVYLIDENFDKTNNAELPKLLKQIRDSDSEATTICYTVSDEAGDEIANKDKYDHIIYKTGLHNERTLIQTLSEVYGVEFVMDNSDPEL